MSRGRHATPVKLAKKERAKLLSLIERKTAAQRDVMRARIALWVRIPMKPAMHSNLKPATDSETKPASVPI